MAKIREFSVSRGIPIPYKTELYCLFIFWHAVSNAHIGTIPQKFCGALQRTQNKFFLKNVSCLGAFAFSFLLFAPRSKRMLSNCFIARFASPVSCYSSRPQKLAYSLLHVVIFIFKLFCFIMSRMITKT